VIELSRTVDSHSAVISDVVVGACIMRPLCDVCG
jgi:hypothetical protein